MADAAVGILLQKLTQLLEYNYELIIHIHDEVKELQAATIMFRAFLRDCCTSLNCYETFKELTRHIREVAHSAEDAIDSYVIEVSTMKESSSCFCIGRAYTKLFRTRKQRRIALDIKKIKSQIIEIRNNRFFGYEAFTQEPVNQRQRTVVLQLAEGDEVVGLEEETQCVVNRIIGISSEIDVCAIVGMPGIGKTTLARKVFSHQDIEYNFMFRVWVRISKKCDKRQTFQKILEDVNGFSDQSMNDEQLASEVTKVLQEVKCLIVMDDIWEEDDWNDIQSALPRDNHGLKILITTRHTEVGKHADKVNPCYLSFLSSENSWKLLQKRVFRQECCPDNLIDVGRQIADKCGGLPLAIVIIAGILLKKPKDKNKWDDVAKRVSEYVAMDQEKCKEIVRMSYDHLPFHLKPCFLYFGIFPQNFSIPKRTLTNLWISEGFIEIEADGDELEVQAEDYLEELVNRNLVLVGGRKTNERIKTCRVHDVLHDWCKKQAQEENLFSQITDVSHIRPLSHRLTYNTLRHREECRRLSVHSLILNYIESKPYGKCVRSFLSMASDERELPLEYTSFIYEAFPLLRVLDVTSITFQRFPKDLMKLVHLRHVALTISFSTLPACVAKLQHLQVLIVNVKPRGNLTIRANLWEMVRLMHLQTNTTITTLETMKGSNESQIRNLSSLSPDCCTEEFLAMVPYINVLGIRGKLEKILNSNDGARCFDGLAKSCHLNILKLHNDLVYSTIGSGVTKCYLPQHNRFPPNLKQLTLSNTKLDWDQITILGMLPCLVVLKLKEYAFVGTHWSNESDGFHRLEVLYLKGLALEEWNTSRNGFTMLQKIIVKNCEKLKALPQQLVKLSSLQTLDIHCTNREVAFSARDIQKQKESTSNVLKVYIYPPDHDTHLEVAVS